MTSSTREKFLDTAEALFAERGFYGVSIAQIAKDLGLTKQALLHHFSTKEKLYGEVLARISAGFESKQKAVISAGTDPKEQFADYLVSLIPKTPREINRTRLLMRELLDNHSRVETAGTWYLKTFLENMMDMLRAIPGWKDAGDTQALAVVYPLLGAINYYGVSGPTFTGIFGQEKFATLDAAFADHYRALVHTVISKYKGCK